MACCGKAKKVLQKGKNIAVGYVNLARGKKYEFTDSRIRACHKCNWSYWIGRQVFCRFRLRRFGATLWADPFAYIPGFARIETEKCFLGNWKGEDQ